MKATSMLKIGKRVKNSRFKMKLQLQKNATNGTNDSGENWNNRIEKDMEKRQAHRITTQVLTS